VALSKSLYGQKSKIKREEMVLKVAQQKPKIKLPEGPISEIWILDFGSGQKRPEIQKSMQS
jgi:hypothetical protein